MPINPNESWKKSSEVNNTYTISFQFKANDKKFIMPTIEVLLFNGKTLVEKRQISGREISFSEIANGDERFSKVIAQELSVNTSKTKQYDNKNVLTIIDINAVGSNLEDFYIQGYEDQGISLIEENYPNQHLIYYLVAPVHKKSIVFNYYNTTNRAFKKIVVPIVLDEELVSTQTDLNPNSSKLEFYKKIAIGVLALLLLVLFIWKRSYLVLVLFLIVTIVFIVFAMPSKSIKLKEGSVIYILPTKNSTIFQKTVNTIVVEDLKRKNGFVKIMFGSGTSEYIGWVKEEDVIKN